MGRYRTVWCLLAAALIDERRPRCVQLETDVNLTVEPQRADLLLIFMVSPDGDALEVMTEIVKRLNTFEFYSRWFEEFIDR